MMTKMNNEKMNGNVEVNIWKLIRQRSMGEERVLKAQSLIFFPTKEI